jgi:hypothetical protein
VEGRNWSKNAYLGALTKASTNSRFSSVMPVAPQDWPFLGPGCGFLGACSYKIRFRILCLYSTSKLYGLLLNNNGNWAKYVVVFFSWAVQ